MYAQFWRHPCVFYAIIQAPTTCGYFDKFNGKEMYYRPSHQEQKKKEPAESADPLTNNK